MVTFLRLVRWIKDENPRLRRTRARNAARAVWAILWVRRPVLSALARAFGPPVSARDHLKRLWRFLHNPHVSANALLWPMIPWAWRMLGRPNPWFWAVDWTMFDAPTVPLRRWQILTISAVGSRANRGVPLSLCVADRDRIARSQPFLEQQALAGALRHVPAGVRVIVLLDRGFQGNPTLEWLTRQHVGFVVRLNKARVLFDHTLSPPRRLCLRDLRIAANQGQWYPHVSLGLYHDRPRRNRFSLAVARGPNQQAPWYLIGNLPNFGQTVEAYFLRMQAEQLHRDLKQLFSLRQCQILSTHAFANLLAILFLAIQQLTAVAFEALNRNVLRWANVRSSQDLSLLNLALVLLLHTLTQRPSRAPPTRQTG